MAMRKIILMAMLPFLFLTNVFSQTDKAVEDIAKVKGDTSYVYAEATMKSLDEAFVGAKSILEMKVAEWVKVKGISGVDVCIAKAKEHCFEVQTRRGEYYRAFVYVRKSDIMPVTDKKEIVVFDVSEQDTATKKSTHDDVISESSPVQTERQIMLNDVEKTIIGVRKFEDIKPFVTQMETKGRISAYGKYKNMPKNGTVYLFVYNKDGIIQAHLRRSDNGVINLQTLKSDLINSYANCGAIWFQLK